MIARIVGLVLAKKKEPYFDNRFKKEFLKKLIDAGYYRFKRYPWLIWNYSFIFLLINIYFTYLIYTESIHSYITITFNIILYYIYFIILYSGKIEKLTVNRKKNIVKLTYYNIFLSKTEKVKYLDEVKDIEILRKGMIKRGFDTTKFYVRITFYDNTKFDWGETVHFVSVTDKYKQCVALIKQIVVGDVVSDDFVTNEIVGDDSEYRYKYYDPSLSQKNTEKDRMYEDDSDEEFDYKDKIN